MWGGLSHTQGLTMTTLRALGRFDERLELSLQRFREYTCGILVVRFQLRLFAQLADSILQLSVSTR